MRIGRSRRLTALLVGVVLGGPAMAGCGVSAWPQAEGVGLAPVGGDADQRQQPSHADQLAIDRARASADTIAAGGADAPYNYVPTVMADDAGMKMWWCSQYSSAPPPGDDVLYGQAASLDGPFRAPDGQAPPAVLSGAPGQFDGMHTCDPSVVRVGATYYMYYTGAGGDHELGNAIGVATSSDGIHWTRSNGGQPIVTAAMDTPRQNTYGSGQPAVVFLDGWFYLMFTDTTGKTAGWNGAGQFMLRAPEPTFTRGVETLGPDGFTHTASTKAPRTKSLVDAFSADLMWVDRLGAFAIAHETDQGTSITFWNKDFSAQPFQPIVIEGPWREGPGLVRTPEGHAPKSGIDPCDRVPFDVVRATAIGPANAPTDLRSFGVDVHGVGGCTSQRGSADALNGVAMPSPNRTMDLVTDGKLVRIDRRSVAGTLATRTLDHRPAAADQLPVAGQLRSGADAIEAPGTGPGLVFADGSVWPVRVPGLIELNGSQLRQVSRQEWDSHPAGSSLG